MGNCQAAEVASVVVQHPGNDKIERMYYWSVTANEVMSSNPGYYVALVVGPGQPNNGKTQPIKSQLKLLRPEDSLHIGHVYRLISFEDVIKEYAENKSVKVGKLLKGSAALGVDMNMNLGACGSNLDLTQPLRDNQQGGSNLGMRQCSRGQWRPALQSIAET